MSTEDHPNFGKFNEVFHIRLVRERVNKIRKLILHHYRKANRDKFQDSTKRDKAKRKYEISSIHEGGTCFLRQHKAQSACKAP